MRDDERLFSFGFGFFLFTLVIVAVFHVAFSSDEKKLRRQNAKITSLTHELANASVRFSELVQPDVLRPIVMRIYPNYRPIGTGRIISVKNME